MSQVSALIVENQPIFREALKAILTGVEGFNIVGETVSAKEACDIIGKNKPQIIITSYFRDKVLGPCTIKQANSMDTGARFVVFVDPQIASAAEIQRLLCSSNVLGLLSPDVSTDEIKSAVKKVSDGDYFIDGRITELLAGIEKPQKTYDLSARQLQILKMIADGFTNKRISSELGISQDTVKTHVRAILKKLDASDRAQAVSKAYKADILSQNASI
jgi:DNA-binding NarL/FixJ family response regulator